MKQLCLVRIKFLIISLDVGEIDWISSTGKMELKLKEVRQFTSLHFIAM